MTFFHPNMYGRRRHWPETIEYAKTISEVKNNSRMTIPVFGNGDVNSPEKAIEMRDRYGLDGAMIGRASIGNPWFFNHVKHYFKTAEHLPYPMINERIEMARRHLEMSIKWKGEKLGVLETRRHYSNYFKGIHKQVVLIDEFFTSKALNYILDEYS